MYIYIYLYGGRALTGGKPPAGGVKIMILIVVGSLGRYRALTRRMHLMLGGAAPPPDPSCNGFLVPYNHNNKLGGRARSARPPKTPPKAAFLLFWYGLHIFCMVVYDFRISISFPIVFHIIYYTIYYIVYYTISSSDFDRVKTNLFWYMYICTYVHMHGRRGGSDTTDENKDNNYNYFSPVDPPNNAPRDFISRSSPSL